MTNDLITIKEYCIHYKVEPSFIDELENLGLINVLQENEEKYIRTEQLAIMESYTRMFYELEINMAGIDAIQNLLDKIHILQNEMTELRNRLRYYEV